MEGLVVLVLLTLAAIPILLPIVSVLVALRNQARLFALEETTARLQRDVDGLTARLQKLRAGAVVEPGPIPTPEKPAAAYGMPPQLPAPVAAPSPSEG